MNASPYLAGLAQLVSAAGPEDGKTGKRGVCTSATSVLTYVIREVEAHQTSVLARSAAERTEGCP